MWLEKISIDGKTYYREVEEEPIPKEETVKERGETLKEMLHGAVRLGQVGVSYVSGLWKRAIEKGKTWRGIFDTKRGERTDACLLEMLPYMEEAERHAVFVRLSENVGRWTPKEVFSALPYFTAEERDTLFLLSLRQHGIDEMDAWLSHVSADCLHRVVEGFFDGEYRGLAVGRLCPYLSKEDIKRLYEYYTEI